MPFLSMSGYHLPKHQYRYTKTRSQSYRLTLYNTPKLKLKVNKSYLDTPFISLFFKPP